MDAAVTVVWLDLENAKIFHFSNEQMKREVVRAQRREHHTHRREGHEKDCEQMYSAIIDRLPNDRKVLILGPGVARTHLFSRLQERRPLIAKNVVACAASDHPTDGEIAAQALKYIHR